MTATRNEIVNSDIYMDLKKFGKFQYIQYFLICLPILMVSMVHVNYIFVAEDVNHRCLVPKCEDKNPSVEIPGWWPRDVDARCFRPVVRVDESNSLTNETCSNATFSRKFEECNEWVYEHNNSVISELNAACPSWKATLIGTFHNAGMMISMIITGLVADKFGRKITVIICSVGGIVGLIKIFLTNFYLYLAIEFLESVLASGLYTIAVVLFIEVGGESTRVLSAVLLTSSIHVGEVIFGLMAMGLKYWKYLILVAYSPMVIFVLYIFVLRESARWHMLRGKISEAKETLKVIARINKLSVTAQEITDIKAEDLCLKFNVVEQKVGEKFIEILRSKEIMIRLSVSSFCFFSTSFIYYGLAVNSVLLPGNKYTNFILASLASMPGDAASLFVFRKFGRRITLQCGFIFCAIFLIAHSYVPESITWLKILLFLCGKPAVIVCFSGVYMYNVDLFPTSLRGTLFGVCNAAARIGGMLSPLTPLLAGELESLPTLLFSSTAILSAVLLTFTPETTNLPMFDTLEQIEKYKAKTMTHL